MEEDRTSKFARLFKSRLDETVLNAYNLTLGNNLFLETEVAVPYQHVYRPGELRIRCLNQDIAIYKYLIDRDFQGKTLHYQNQKESIFSIALDYSVKGKPLEIKDDSNTVIENYFPTEIEDNEGKISFNKLGFPYLIIEAKNGDSNRPTTDAILCAAKKSSMIKSIFPHCRSVLLVYVEGKTNLRTFRLGLSSFDDIIELDLNSEDSRDSAIRKLNAHFACALEYQSRA